jgi:hypothetical protein
VQLDGEHRRRDRAVQHVLGAAAVVLARRVHVELTPVAQQGLEERQALDVIPVQMTDQAARLQRLVLWDGVAEVAQAGTEVEQYRRVSWDVDGDARRVAPVPRDLGSVARGRAPNPVERDFDGIPSDWGTLPLALTRSVWASPGRRRTVDLRSRQV